MGIKFLNGVCQCCKQRVEAVIDEANNVPLKNDLYSFSTYKDLELSICPNCGFISKNIIKDDASYVKNKDKFNYDYYYNYEYLPSLKKIDDYEVKSYSPNIDECYARGMLSIGDTDNAIRFMYKAIETKINLFKKLQNDKFEDYDIDEIQERENIDTVCHEIEKSVIENRKEIVKMFTGKENVFSLILYMFTLKSLNEDKKLIKAKNQFDKLTNVSQDLVDYVNAKLG